MRSMTLDEALDVLERNKMRVVRLNESTEKTLGDYLDEVEQLDGEAYDELIDMLVADEETIVQDDSGCYYDTTIGRDSMTDNPVELLDFSISYDDIVAEYGTPEEFVYNK